MRNQKTHATLLMAVTIATLSAASPALYAQSTQNKPPATQPKPGTSSSSNNKTPANSSTAPIAVPADYVIGASDILTIKVWRDDTLSTDAVVRPDGKITMLLLNDVQATGLKPEALGANISKALASGGFKEDPSVTVIVKQINSRMVYITGQVSHSGPFPLSDHMTVAQLIAIAGGVADFAHKDDMTLLHLDGTSQRINYKDIEQRKNLKQNNVELRIGDQLIVR